MFLTVVYDIDVNYALHLSSLARDQSSSLNLLFLVFHTSFHVFHSIMIIHHMILASGFPRFKNLDILCHSAV
jgi:hypothetical protein